MRYRPLGESGIHASIVGLGTWVTGGWMWGGAEEDESIRAIQASIDAGINLIDTAPIYGFGRSEEIVGKAIKGRRDKVVLATKCGLVWNTDKGDFFFTSNDKAPTEGGDREVRKYLGADSIAWEVEQSLKRLGVDVIDLYQTHWQETTTPIADTMAALVKLKDQGKIRAIGVSNATPEQMDEYRAVGQLDTDQERYSMLDRKLENAILPYVREHNIAELAYSPIEQGLLTGKTSPDRTFEEGDQRRNNPKFKAENVKKVNAMLDQFKPIAEQHGATITQLVIAWTVSQPGLSHALVGARNVEQAQANAGAGAIELSVDEVSRMNDILAEHAGALA